MRLTVDIAEFLLQEIQQVRGQQRKSQAIRQARDEFVTARKRKRFLRKVMEGGVDYGLTNDELAACGT